MIHCSSFYFAVYFSAICVFRFGCNSYWFILFNHLIVVVLGMLALLGVLFSREGYHLS